MHIRARFGENSSRKPQIADRNLIDIGLLTAEVGQTRNKLENLRQALPSSLKCGQIVKFTRMWKALLQIA
jgi:hypothetical protein